MNRVASFVVLLAILVAISIVFYRVMADFLLPLFIAAFLVVIFRPVHDRIVETLQGRRHIAAALTTMVMLVIVLLPTVSVITIASLESLQLISEIRIASRDNPLRRLREAVGVEHPAIQEIKSIDGSFEELLTLLNGRNNQLEVQAELRKLKRLLNAAAAVAPNDADRESLARVQDLLTPLADLDDIEKLEQQVNVARLKFAEWKINEFGGSAWAYLTELSNPNEEEWRRINSSLFSRGQSLLVQITTATSSTLASLLISTIIAIVAFFFFLCDGPYMVKSVMELSPLDDRYEKELLNEFVSVSRAVLLATLLSAAAQAMLAGVGYYFAGVEAVFLLAVMTGILAMIPLVGTFGVWGPVCAWLYFVEGRPVPALILTVYCTAVVSTVDNVIKPYVLHGQSRLHPLLALLSVLGGVKLLGPIGILIGPMCVVFLQTLLKILHRELLHFDEAGRLSVATGSGPVELDSTDDGTLDPEPAPAGSGTEEAQHGDGEDPGEQEDEAAGQVESERETRHSDEP